MLHNVSVNISGSGILSAVGQGVDAFNQALFSGLTSFQRSEQCSQLSFPVVLAELPSFDFHAALLKCELPDDVCERAYRLARRYPLTIQTSVIAALEAWYAAGLATQTTIDSTRIGLIICGNNTTSHYQYQQYSEHYPNSDFLMPSYALHFMDSDQVGLLSELLGIHGPGITVGAASASGQAGIIQGARWIQQGLVDACLVVGVMADLSPLQLQAFHSLGALGGRKFSDQPARACRPFDVEHEGFIPGQASACVVLESGASLEKRDVTSQGELLGMALCLAGNRSSHPNVDAEIQAMDQALNEANLCPDDIGYINTHGSSSQQGDKAEAQALEAVFSVTQAWVNATKSITGHCLWSAGVVELIASLLQLNQGFAHGNKNLTTPVSSSLRFVAESSLAMDCQYALSNAYGFGGINSSIIIQKKN